MSEFMEDITRRLTWMEREIRRLSAEKQQFEILNHDQNESIVADQNNYALGDYDFLLLEPTANRNIHGITNGEAGRHLHIFNTSASFTLTFTHQNAAATAANRIATATSGSIVLGTRKWAHLVYIDAAGAVTGNTRWLLLYPQA